MGGAHSRRSNTKAASRPLKEKDIKSPTPSDIEIAQSIDPIPISQIAASLGLDPDEVDLYGPTKAKVKLNVLDRLGEDAPNGRQAMIILLFVVVELSLLSLSLSLSLSFLFFGVLWFGLLPFRTSFTYPFLSSFSSMLMKSSFSDETWSFSCIFCSCIAGDHDG